MGYKYAGQVILKLDSLEKVGLNLEFAEVDTLKMVSNGLNDALTEVNKCHFDIF